MTTITLKDGTVLEALCINGLSVHFQGASRDSLEIHFSTDLISLDQIDELFSEENCSRVILTTGTESTAYNDYVLKVAIMRRPVVITESFGLTPSTTETRNIIQIAQKTYFEKQLESLRETVDILTLESLGVS